MANCISCSAALPAPSNVCEYCGRRNDVDLHGVHRYTVVKPNGERSCPRCEVGLHTINLKHDGKFFIERCDQCMGLFFDVNELEALLEQSVSNVFEINQQRLSAINKELYQRDSANKPSKQQAFYVKCPVCRDFMQRKNFGARSGVIIDRCHQHGVWLDGGELKRLMEWKKAGGQLLHEKMAQERSAAKAKRYESVAGRAEAIIDTRENKPIWGTSDDDFLSSVFKIVGKLF
ncbi:MAG: zf-TFIIB domain-containing protein [Gammaproteobacteria bacterium]|nr:zf-TFIIB domain-containing protein [Gammaproteobacteria bacterium]